MSDNAIVLHDTRSGVLARIGTPDERKYLIEIMAEQLGIPASQATRPDVLALLGAAAQHAMQYGWVPGIHTHVQKFESDDSKSARSSNQDAKASYNYTLVVGEKAWKDSAARWRERGVQWRYQRKPMTIEEVAEEARLQGFNEKIAGNSYGFWSRILILGQDDPNDENDPTWSAGIWFGKIKVGKWWKEDGLPTGVSARDVSIRRADKRAIMQSQLSLIPVDDLSGEARIQRLTDNLRGEAQVRQRAEAPFQPRVNVVMEEDGDAIWALEPAKAGARPGAQPKSLVHGQVTPEKAVARPEMTDVDFWGDDPIATTQPQDEPLEAVARPVAEPANPGARPEDRSQKCPVCHAPPGKPHTKRCTASQQAPAQEAVARPEVTPEKAVARPEEPAKPPTFEERVYNRCTAIYGSTIPLSAGTTEFVRRCRNSDHDSAMAMSRKYYDAIITLMGTHLGTTRDEADMIMAALLGYAVNHKRMPGQSVHGYLVKPLREGDVPALEAMAELMELCQAIYVEEEDGG